VLRRDSDNLADLDEELKAWLRATWDGRGQVLFLTGAGVSAESGIPTFRGEEGYWRVGSRNYVPEDLATRTAFQQMPNEIWGWYLYRRSVCRAASPNPAHMALADLERSFVDDGRGDAFLLASQNIDGLHLRAGNTPERLYQVHGNIDHLRCFRECGARPYPIPKSLGVSWNKGRAVTEEEQELLRCPQCGGPGRPHVLWFDETYDETHFRFDSAIAAAERAALVVVVGTSGATNLPRMLVRIAEQRGAPLLVINRDPSPFSDVAQESPSGYFVQGAAGVVLPSLVDALLEC